MNNGTDTVGFDDGPDEEDDTGRGHKVGLDSEQMANLVDWEPNSW